MSVLGYWDWLLYLFIAGFLATDFWRFLGVFTGSRIDANGEVFQWVRAVSTSLVAALVTRIVFFPPGSLAEVPTLLRLLAFMAGVLPLFFGLRSLLSSILLAEAVLVVGMLIY